jgi:hypothetical protein
MKFHSHYIFTAINIRLYSIVYTSIFTVDSFLTVRTLLTVTVNSMWDQRNESLLLAGDTMRSAYIVYLDIWSHVSDDRIQFTVKPFGLFLFKQ